MRKLTALFAFMVIALTSYAQSSSEHLSFKGIPIEGSMGLTKKSPPKKKFSLSADMRELLCIFRLPNQCKYT